ATGATKTKSPADGRARRTETDVPRQVRPMSRDITERRGRDSNPRTRLTPVTRFPVAPVQPLRHLSTGTRPREYLQAPLAALEHRYLLAGGGDAGDRHVVAADHEVDVDARVVQPPLILVA